MLPDNVRHRHLFSLARKVGLSQVLVTGQDEWLDLWQTVKSILAEAQVILDDLLRCQAKPLSDGDIVIDG